MKKILASALLLAGLSACYKDLGNYKYNFDDLNDISELIFTPEPFAGLTGTTIEIQQPLREDRTERITVDLKQSKGQSLDDIDFTWVLKHTEIVGRDTIKHVDTLRTKGYLDVLLKGGKPSKYEVQLQVFDRTTQLSRHEKLTIQTRPIYKNSLFVLHGTNQDTKLGNIEEVSAGTEVTLDAFQKLYPEQANPFAKASKMTYTAYLDGRTQTSRLAVFTTDGNATVYDPFGLEAVFDRNYVLPNSSTPFITNRAVNVGDISKEKAYRALLSYDGRFYVGKDFLSFHQPGKGLTDYKVTAMTMTDSHFVVWDEQNERFLMLLKQDGFARWDEKKARSATWLTRPVVNANVDLDVRHSPKGKKAVYAYISYRENYEEAHPFFIFSDQAGKNFYHYELRPVRGGKDDGKDDGKSGGKSDGKDDKKDDGKSDGKDDKKDDGKSDGKDDKKDDGKSDGKDDKKDDGKSDGKDDKKDDGKSDGKDDKKDDGKSDGKDDKKDDKDDKKDDKDDNSAYENGPAQFTLVARPLTGIDSRINPLTIVYNPWFTTNYIFYGAGNSVYRYNVSSGDNMEIYTAPEGYSVSVLKFRTEDVTLLLKDLGLYLSVGLNKGNEGAVAELKLTTSADVDERYAVKLHTQDKRGNKFGNIRDLQFAHTYIYETKQK